jgi:hypothetical protein
MAIQLGVTLRNNKANQLESTVGVSPKLQIFTGAQPANCAAADTGTKLAELSLPSDWMAAASSGSVGKNGTWSGVGLPAAGTGTAAAHFRIKDSTGATCHLQGTVTVSGGGGDMTLDNVSISSGQNITVNTFTLTEGNA